MSDTGGPCCACLSVSYEPEKVEGGARDRWVCNDCGAEFVRGAFADYWDQGAADEMAILRHKMVAKDAINKHLSAEVRALKDEVYRRDCDLEGANEEVVKLRTLLRTIRYLPIDRDTDSLEGYTGAVRAITRHIIENQVELDPDAERALYKGRHELYDTASGSQECTYCQQEMDAPICGNQESLRDGTMVCTRKPDHSGRHTACGTHHNIGSWPNDTADGSPAPIWPEGATPCSACSEPAVINLEGVMTCLCCGASADSRRERPDCGDLWHDEPCDTCDSADSNQKNQ